MNRYPWWKYLIIAIALFVGTLFTLPNFFGEAPAVQISSGKATVKISADAVDRARAVLQQAGVTPDFVELDGSSVRVRLADTDIQVKARDALVKGFNPDASDPAYIVALSLVPRSPQWLRYVFNPKPMFLGLDLRGGVHFLMQVDMQAALTQKVESLAADARTLLHDKDIRHAGIRREGTSVVVRFRDAATLQAARGVLQDALSDLLWSEGTESTGEPRLVGALNPKLEHTIQDQALKQNITTLQNRINELGVSEPVIQQQGVDRVVVQLPGVQDTAKAKDIIGRTATLEVRMVDDSSEAEGALRGGMVPYGSERYADREGMPIIVKRQVILTGNNLNDAQPGFDENHDPAVMLTLDAQGARIFRDVTRENINKRMAILLFEKGKGEVVTAPVIRGEISGGRVQISGGRMSSEEAADTSLLLRAGSLAAPMDIIEERTVGPSLGAENIAQGFNSLIYGFAAIAIFMVAYYLLFGVFSTLALSFNLLLLVAVLSMLQATLTLPGIAAIALTLGMAIDSNVLINERVREELRNGSPPQTAIHAGYEHAWSTILDSNVTTLIVGISLFICGTGPVRGFAVVHCLGILTSMFSAVFFSRGLVNLWYGRQRKLKSVSIGQLWKPQS